jgi:hypothetical protein
MVVSDLAKQLDACVVASSKTSCNDVPVLISPKKARRLTSILKSQAGVGVGTSDDAGASKVFVVNRDRGTSQREAESAQMASYLSTGTCLMAGSLQVGMSVDCSSVSSRELLTLAVYTAEASDGDEAAMWLPSQDCLCCLFFVCCFQIVTIRTISGPPLGPHSPYDH